MWVASPSLLGRYLKRLGTVLGVWCLFYGLLPKKFLILPCYSGFRAGFWEPFVKQVLVFFKVFFTRPEQILFHATSYHLWFFPSLIMGLLIISVFLFYKKEKYHIFPVWCMPGSLINSCSSVISRVVIWNQLQWVLSRIQLTHNHLLATEPLSLLNRLQLLFKNY